MSPLRTQHLSPSSVCVFFFASFAHLFFGYLSPLFAFLLYLLNTRVLGFLSFLRSQIRRPRTDACVSSVSSFHRIALNFLIRSASVQRENGELSRAHTEIRQQHRASSHIFRDHNCKCERNKICIELRLNARMKLRLVRITSNATHINDRHRNIKTRISRICSTRRV